MTKAELRAEFLARRRALPAGEVFTRSKSIADTLFAIPSVIERISDLNPSLSANVVVHTFLPIARHKEVDTWLIIHRFWHYYPGVQVAVPVTEVATNTLTHHALTPATPLVESALGILEPLPSSNRVLPDSINIVLVPLLAFDHQGHRVGYGKGFYDRFLVQCRPDCLKIGLSLFEPVEHVTDIESTDVQIDICVTPTTYYNFRL